MAGINNPHLSLHLGIIFVGAFQARFTIKIFKEVNTVICFLDMKVVISH